MKFSPTVLVIGSLCVLSASAQAPQSDLKRAGLIGPVYAVSTIAKMYAKSEGKWIDSIHATCYYDKNGSLTLELDYVRDKALTRRTFSSPAAGQVIEKIESIKPVTSQSDPPSISVLTARHVFQLGDGGRIEAESITYDNGSKEEVEYKYDNQGRLERETKKQDSPAGTFTTINTYGSGPLETAAAHYNPYPTLVSSQAFTYEFDSHGNWIKKKIVESPEPPAEISIERIITYYSPETGVGEPIPGERPDDPLQPSSAGRPKVIRKSGGVLTASAKKQVPPTYPQAAKAAHITGQVLVEVMIDEDGKVISAKALSGPDELRDAAVAAAKQWTFAPTKLSGERVKVAGTLTFNFQM